MKVRIVVSIWHVYHPAISNSVLSGMLVDVMRLFIYEMNFTLCVLLVYNDNGSVQTLCITRVSALSTKCLHRPIVIINQQYTKGEIHFIYLHYFHVFGFCFINRYHGNGCVSLENPTVCTVNGRA